MSIIVAMKYFTLKFLLCSIILIQFNQALLNEDCSNKEASPAPETVTVKQTSDVPDSTRELNDEKKVKPSPYNSIDGSQKKHIDEVIINDVKGVNKFILS
jgi:hypothetical protein